MRRYLSERLERHRYVFLEQFFTPAPIARFMAKSFEARQPVLQVPGGTSSFSAAFVKAMARRECRPQAISITAFEIDSKLIPSRLALPGVTPQKA